MKRPVPYGTKPVGAIYRIVCNATGDMYIGSTGNLATRWQSHMSMARSGCNSKLYSFMRSKGVESFSMEIMLRETGDVGEMQCMENVLIAELDPTLNTVKNKAPGWLRRQYRTRLSARLLELNASLPTEVVGQAIEATGLLPAEAKEYLAGEVHSLYKGWLLLENIENIAA